jgi:hypothetical protein
MFGIIVVQSRDNHYVRQTWLIPLMIWGILDNLETDILATLSRAFLSVEVRSTQKQFIEPCSLKW